MFNLKNMQTMINNLVDHVYGKILSNSNILINELANNFSGVTITGRLFCIIYSTALTLDLTFPNKSYKNFDIDLLLDLVVETVNKSQKLINDGVSKQNSLLQDEFFEEQLNLALNYSFTINYDKEMLLNDIKIFLNERNRISKAFTEKRETLFYYNCFINFYVFAYINSIENSHEKINIIIQNLDCNNDFTYSKNKFVIEFHKICSRIYDEVASMDYMVLVNVMHNGYIKKQENKNCYIATLAYGDINHPQVELLRDYRDNKLEKTILGNSFIKLYYAVSPTIVKYLTNKHKTNNFIKNILDDFITNIKK